MIRKCTPSDLEEMFAVINDAAQAYKGVIPVCSARHRYAGGIKEAKNNHPLNQKAKGCAP
jgi:hypothetical protein